MLPRQDGARTGTLTTGRHSVPLRLLVTALLLAALAAACAAQPVEDTPAPTETRVFQPASTATPVSQVEPLQPDEIEDVLREVICWYDDPGQASACIPPGEETLAALQRIALSADPRFIAPLVDMLWLEVGWERWVLEALERVSEQRFATVADWVRWIALEQPPLPEGYSEWKGRLLSLVDERFAVLIHDEGGLGAEQLVWAHVSSTDFPPLTEPTTVHRVEQNYLAPADRVIGVLIDGEARAYPERIIAWHGIVRDSVAGRPIVIWHCPSCGGAVAFDARASNGSIYTFGTSGLAYDSRRLVFDEQTRSLWDPVSGQPLHGPLAGAEVTLNLVNTQRTTWGSWSARYPNTRVLGLDTGHVRDYDEGVALRLEQATEGPTFPVVELDDRHEPKRHVLGVSINGQHKAYDLARVETMGLLRDTVGGQSILILGFGPGQGATVYAAGGVTFQTLQGAGENREVIDDEDLAWWVDEEGLLNQRNGTTLPMIPSQVAYWFAWSGAHPTTALWNP